MRQVLWCWKSQDVTEYASAAQTTAVEAGRQPRKMKALRDLIDDLNSPQRRFADAGDVCGRYRQFACQGREAPFGRN